MPTAGGPLTRRLTRHLAALVGAVALLVLAAASAHAACEVQTAEENFEEEAACGPINTDPPPAEQKPPPPRIVAWASGYDINPLGGSGAGSSSPR